MKENLKQRSTITQKILFDREAFRSQMLSEAILRYAKVAAEKSHQEALRAKAAYDAQHGRV